MREVGVVIGILEEPLYWHSPGDRSVAYLPDSVDLWGVLWAYRSNLRGFAPRHPGAGRPRPSSTDLTTFAAIETGLGERYNWYIVSKDRMVGVYWVGPGRCSYTVKDVVNEPGWADELRRLSHYEEE